MEKRRYVDFFTVPEDYKANMTREIINETPERWLDFYPHEQYIRFLNTLLQEMDSGNSKSTWLTGNYGTGKSNAALVTQKLFMDDEIRVRKWFDIRKNEISDKSLLDRLLTLRQGTLVVYDYNSDGLGPDDEFLIQLERGISAALIENNLSIPPKSNLDTIIQRLRREGTHFFETRDSMQNELAYLNAKITTVEQLADELKKGISEHLLGDVQSVLRRDSIYFDITVNALTEWTRKITEINGLKRIIYIFDEFSRFIDDNKEHLKTFEEIAEKTFSSRLYFVPVTHMSLGAYAAEGSDSAKKANDRFFFRSLTMPNDTAFGLAASAIKVNSDPKIAEEWGREKDILWESVRGIAETHFDSKDVSKKSFYNILPIHPMTAFLLKFLAESARSNQRSIFEYLKGSADGREFQDFIRTGGPGIDGKQFLTADYLWKYFIEREDLGQNKEIIDIRNEFERIRSREFQNKDDNDEDIRVLKAVLLFCLLGRLTKDGHDRLKPTVKNIELAFQGDASIVGVDGIIKRLEEKRCFSVVSGNINLLTTSVGNADLQSKMAEIENKFHELLSDETATMLQSHIRAENLFSNGRLDLRVSDVDHTTLTNITQSTRDKYSAGLKKDNGAVCLWFVVAKNKEEQLKIPDKIKAMLTNLSEHRIMMFTFPNMTFCSTNTDLWNDYVKQYSEWFLENTSAKSQRERALTGMRMEWFDRLKKPESQIKAYYVENGQIITNDVSWISFKELLKDYVQRKLPYCADFLSLPAGFKNQGLRAWAMGGINFGSTISGPLKQFVDKLKEQEISGDDAWFSQHVNHPFARIRELFDKEIINTVEKGKSLSIVNVYSKLKRAPFGMKQNCLSAFSLGFALRHILDRGYQWDNSQITRELVADTLSEMIEEVVKDDGEEKIKQEKKICLLSPEEKVFVEYAPKMFGISGIATDARVEEVLVQIQNRIQKISGRVPLWVLPEFIRSKDEPLITDIEEVLNNICLAGTISSKTDKNQERKSAIKDIGRTIQNNPELVGIVANYIKDENFITAFQLYIDKHEPKLNSLAKSVGDVSHGYCQIILSKAAETAGFLWNQSDIDAEIKETMQEYEIIKLMKPIIGVTDFVQYKSIIDTLNRQITVENKLPKTIILSAFPSLSDLVSSILNGRKPNEIKNELEQNISLIRDLFFNPKKIKSIEILRPHLIGIEISDVDLLSIYNGLPSAFSNDESAFLQDTMKRIEKYKKDSIAQHVKSEWNRITGSLTPSVWSLDTGIPARFALKNIPYANDIIIAVEKPEDFSSHRLSVLSDTIKNLPRIEIAECQMEFLSETLSTRFSSLDISFSSMISYLRKKYGAQPNDWPIILELGSFIVEQYQGTVAPQVAEKIKKTSADELKDRLLQLVKDNPDLGLLFWKW